MSEHKTTTWRLWLDEPPPSGTPYIVARQPNRITQYEPVPMGGVFLRWVNDIPGWMNAHGLLWRLAHAR